MSDSKLVNVTMISPNRDHPRNHKIDTVTIHCMAGNLTVETCGRMFLQESRQASSNYGIGSDGRIGLYCHEEDRSWCSGSAANDNRAITIEVANDGGTETDWHVSDLAMRSLLDLLEDICRRNGIKALLWESDRSLIGQINRQNMTVHRWFQKKACPGDFLFGKHYWIAQEVNKRLEGEDMTRAEIEDLVDKKIKATVPGIAADVFNGIEKARAEEPASSWMRPDGRDDGRDLIQEAKDAGIMSGDKSGNFRPQSYAKREELAAVALAVYNRTEK